MRKGEAMTPLTIGFSEAKAKLSQLTEEVNRTGRSVVVYKHNKPWVTIEPAVQNSVFGNQETAEAMAEAERMMADKNTKFFDNVDDMFEDLGI
jgi:prevent-host-death family protein